MNTTQFVILGLLTEAPLSGYDIRKIIGTRFRFFWSESFGQIYPMLRELEKNRCVELSAGDGAPAEGGRNRKEYRITDTGFEKLRSWLASPPEKELTRFELLVKVYFGHLAAKDAVRSFIEDFGADHGRDLDSLYRMREELQSILHMHDNHPFILTTIELGIKVNEAYVAWAAESAAYLKNLNTE